MDIKSFAKINLSLLLVMNFILSGCLPSDKADPIQSASAQTGSTTGSTTGGSVAPTTTLPTVEIRHLIEPNLSNDPTYSTGTGIGGGGSYVRKLTLPKNFAGRLYVAGINVGTLANRFVKVRFKFGMNGESVTIPGTIAEAPGITPSTGVNVLVLDMRSEPFRNVRLPYDLYDYNEYNSSPIEPTQDNRDSGLYCRGLKLADDPTFTGTNGCDEEGEECLYSYAKVLDQGLVKLSSGVLVPTTPTLPQVKSVTGLNYYQDYPLQQLKKPLLDEVVLPYRFSDPNTTTGSEDILMGFAGRTFANNAGTYYYRGPYRLLNRNEWQFNPLDLTITKGLFRSSLNIGMGAFPEDPGTSKLYYHSNMFPLATKISLNANVAHLSSAAYDGTRFDVPLTTAGKTAWMDGSNARAQSKNADLEHIGSCNVTGSMELIARDDNNVEYVIALAQDVKLQLVRPTQIYTDTGNEVLYSNYKSCSSNASCGGSECCFNNRCWDSSLVSQCFDNSNTQGNRNVGDACISDLQCSSLCCNTTSGVCSPHNPSLATPVLCSKPIGSYCISKDWCQQSPVTTWLVVKTGTDAGGNVTCAQRPYTKNVYGDCRNSICIPPVQNPQPVFDSTAAGACNNAVPAPSF
jgi:hypothetical protein